jgi:predicted metal-dependent hydrolase
VSDIELVRHPTARRMRLVIDPRTGRARLTIPKRESERKALAWAAEHAAWLAAERARLPQPRPFADGAVIPFGDGTLTIAWTPGTSRLVRLDGDRLILSGPPETLARRVEAWLRRVALRLLSEDTAHYAARAGVTVSKVAVGDAIGRWGSCASTGVIRYSWRLVMAPEAVRRATAAHEVAHRLHMNHSRAFHAAVEALYGRAPDAERAWLRANGAALHWIGRAAQ